MKLRPFQAETDSPAVVALLNTYQSEPITPEIFAGWLRRMPPGRDMRRMVAVNENDQVIGYNHANHEDWYPAGRYDVWAIVAAARRHQGIGTILFKESIDYALMQGATLLISEVREIDSRSFAFTQQFGFVLDRHQFESVLDLTTFDAKRFESVEHSVVTSGIHIHSLAELGNTEENRRKLHAVNYATALDIPGAGGRWMPFEQFDQMVSSADWFRAEGQFGALNGEEWIGLSAVELIAETKGAYNLMTGVMPAYRGRGIALALKLAAIRYAQTNGAQYLRTNNDSQNGPMLAVNRKLGYQPLAGIYLLRREERTAVP